MRQDTIKALTEFIQSVEHLAVGCAHMAGMAVVSDVCAKAEALKLELIEAQHPRIKAQHRPPKPKPHHPMRYVTIEWRLLPKHWASHTLASDKSWTRYGKYAMNKVWGVLERLRRASGGPHPRAQLSTLFEFRIRQSVNQQQKDPNAS